MNKKPPMWKRLGLPCPIRVVVKGKRICPHRLYRIWCEMKKRCSKRPSFVRDRHYKYYAHVTLCEEWLDFETFFHWAKDNGYRDDLTIDRIDPSQGYSPENCRWATRSEQNFNRHYTDAYWEMCLRNLAKANAALAAKRAAKKSGACRAGGFLVQ